jgi:2-methylcitrate dehydratase PrpD
VFEGRWGLFASHVQDPNAHRDFGRIQVGLGRDWESRKSSFKPFPCAHVIHPYISAALRLRNQHGIQPGDIERIDCPVTSFIVGIVCEPIAEKFAPASDSHGRVSLQYSIAEALYFGELDNPEILNLASKVRYYVDPDYPGPGRFKGAVKVTLKSGRPVEEVEEYNRGSADNPMSDAELRSKFDRNASGFLTSGERGRLMDEIQRLEMLADASSLLTHCAKPQSDPPARRGGRE